MKAHKSCLCSDLHACMAEAYDDCKNKGDSYSWKHHFMKTKGTRVPKARFCDEERPVQKLQAGVEPILDARWYNGIYQYAVCLEKQCWPDWKNADKLEC